MVHAALVGVTLLRTSAGEVASGRFGQMLRQPPEQLAQLYEAAGLRPDRPVITYCGGGYYGAFSLFVLYQLGYEDVRLYDGSWIEWTSKGGTIETGP